MRNLSKFFIENTKLTLVFMGFLLLWGVMGLRSMNAESWPAVDFATALIETEYYGATPEDIEVKITKPIEDEIRTISGLKDVRSTSQAGRSKIVVRVDMDNPKVIVKDVMADIQRAIDRAKDLPTDLKDKPKFTEIKSEEFAAIEIAVSGSNSKRHRDLVAYSLKEDIEDNRSVKEVKLEGYREREFEIRLSRKKLDESHIGIDEVLAKISARNVNVPGGELEDHIYRRLVKVDGKITGASDLANVVIRSNFSGQKIYLRDVATVVDGQEIARTLTRYGGEKSVLMQVTKKSGADTLKLVHSVNPILERYRLQYPEFKFTVFNDEGVRVEKKLSTLSSNAISGLAVVVAVLMFFMPGRIGIMVAISLPISLMATIGLMPSFGLTLNSITILALIIAMGMLVDNSVVIADEYMRRRKLGSSSLDAMVDTIGEMWVPISATAFTTIAAFLPMMATTGIMGRFIYAIPIVVTSALLFCLVECFFLLPMRLHMVAGKMPVIPDSEKTKAGWFDKVSIRFEKFMEWVVDHRYWTSLAMLLVVVFSFIMIGVFNKFILFPADQTEIYISRLDLPVNTKVEETYKYTHALEEEIHKVLGKEIVKHTISYAGSQLTRPDDVRGQIGDHVGLVRIFATDYAKFNLPHTVVLEKLRAIKIPGANVSFEEQINGPPVGSPVSVTFRSNNSSSLNTLIQKVMADLKQLNGVFDVKVDDVYGPDEVQVKLNYEKVDQLGLTTSSVGNTVRTALTGTLISDVTLNNKEAELNVKLGGFSKKTVKDLAQFKILDSRGNLLPLGLLADFEETRGTPQIKRFDYKRAKTLLGNLDTKVTTSVIANKLVADSFAKHQKDHPDVSIVFGGEQESTNESMKSLGNALIMALIGIYAIMVYIFRSYLAPGLIMTTIPLGLLGISVAFWAHGRPVGFLAMIGVIGLAGIIVNNGIILIDFINQMRAEGKTNLREILIKAPVIRLRPVMASSITTMGGLFPTAYGIGGADSMLVPMTLAMAWGLTTGTILTLVWVPAGYGIIEDFVSWGQKLMKKVKKA